MSNFQNVSQAFTTFFHLTKELEQFVDVSDLRIASDREGNIYLLGRDFEEQVVANFALHREVKNVMRDLIAKYRSQMPKA